MHRCSHKCINAINCIVLIAYWAVFFWKILTWLVSLQESGPKWPILRRWDVPWNWQTISLSSLACGLRCIFNTWLNLYFWWFNKKFIFLNPLKLFSTLVSGKVHKYFCCAIHFWERLIDSQSVLFWQGW